MHSVDWEISPRFSLSVLCSLLFSFPGMEKKREAEAAKGRNGQGWREGRGKMRGEIGDKWEEGEGLKNELH